MSDSSFEDDLYQVLFQISSGRMDLLQRSTQELLRAASGHNPDSELAGSKDSESTEIAA